MGRATAKPMTDPPADYEDDTARWSMEQADLIRHGRFGEVEVENVIEELESLGHEIRHALESSYGLLMSHLLKWQFQPAKRSVSWQVTIHRERSHIARREARNRSLKAEAQEIADSMYPSAVREAALETGLPRSNFPDTVPWTLDQLRDDDFLPE